MSEENKSFVQYYDVRKIKKLNQKNLLFPIEVSLQIIINVDMTSYEEVFRIKKQSILDALPNDIIICHKKLNIRSDRRKIMIDYKRISNGGFNASCYAHFQNTKEITKFKLKL